MQNQILESELEKYHDYLILVEGKRDCESLNYLGFKKVFEIHKTGVAIKENIEQILKETDKKEKICILTDFDKKGKQLHSLVKQILQENGAKIDFSLRDILLKAGVSHIEGLATFIENQSQ